MSFAGAQAYWTLHQNDVLIERAKKRYDAPKNSEIIIETGPSVPQIIIPGGKWYNSRLERATR